MFDALVAELSQRYGLGERGRELFGLLVGYIYNDRRGGFDGFIEGFRLQGHGQQATSWTSPNQQPLPLNASDVGMVFGQGLLNDWGTRLGVSRAMVAAAIAGVLPRLIAELAPGRTAETPRSDVATDSRIAADHAPGDGITTAAADEAAADRRAVFEPAAPQYPAAAPRVTDSVSPGLREPPPPPPQPSRPATHLQDERPQHDPGRIVPGYSDHVGLHAQPNQTPLPVEPGSASASLRREPRMQAAADADDRSLTPAEQRIADMAAALGSGLDGPKKVRIEDEPGNARFDTWRPAIHRPPKRKSSWPIWLLIILLLAAIVAITWYLGLVDTYVAPRLDPLLKPYGFKLLPPPR